MEHLGELFLLQLPAEPGGSHRLRSTAENRSRLLNDPFDREDKPDGLVPQADGAVTLQDVQALIYSANEPTQEVRTFSLSDISGGRCENKYKSQPSRTAQCVSSSASAGVGWTGYKKETLASVVV